MRVRPAIMISRSGGLSDPSRLQICQSTSQLGLRMFPFRDPPGDDCSFACDALPCRVLVVFNSEEGVL